MTSHHHDHVLKVTDLLDRPGSSRPVDLVLPIPGQFALALIELPGPLRLNGVLESVVDGVLVRGTVEADAVLSCARCLDDVRTKLHSPVVELFTDPDRADPEEEPVEEGYELRDGTIDLDGLLRDALAIAVPYQPLCRADCEGLCPTCGANRNRETCECAEEVLDPRWESLRVIELPADEAEGR